MHAYVHLDSSTEREGKREDGVSRGVSYDIDVSCMLSICQEETRKSLVSQVVHVLTKRRRKEERNQAG